MNRAGVLALGGFALLAATVGVNGMTQQPQSATDAISAPGSGQANAAATAQNSDARATGTGADVGQVPGQALARPSGQVAAPSCPARTLTMNYSRMDDGGQVRQMPVWQLPQNSAFFFVAGMSIDADGAPNAYGPENMGLDDLVNAGAPGHWDGIVADETGNPLTQGPDDPYPGFYISCTALSDRTKSPRDPGKFVDATKIPYIVLPGEVSRQTGARLGDFAVVTNMRSGKSSYAIFADIGTFGEGSVALAQNLGIWPDARNGGSRGGVLYLVFPGSGNRQPRPVEEINSEAEKQLRAWGGMDQLNTCSSDLMPAFGPRGGQRRPVDTSSN